MNRSFPTIAGLLTGFLCGTVGASAQLAFGPLSNVGDSNLGSLSIPTDPYAIAVLATFGISGTLTPATGTAAGPTTYTVVFNTVTLSITAADPIVVPPRSSPISPNPFNYGPVSFNVTVTVPPGGGPFSPIPIVPQTVSLPTQSFSVNSTLDGGYSLPYDEDFTVTLAARSAPVEGGGKGVTFNITPEINGTLVPEPGTYALIAGLGLIGFAGYRRLQARKAA